MVAVRYLVALLQRVDHGGESPLRVDVLARQQRVLAVEAAQLAHALLVRRSQLLLHLTYVTTTTSRRQHTTNTHSQQTLELVL